MNKCLFVLLLWMGVCHPLYADVVQPTHAGLTSMTEAPQQKPSQYDFNLMKKILRRPIIALVLGSGGARGYAHIGAIDVLEKQGIHPDFIVGTSAGSLVGALYASGKDAQEIEDIALNMKVNEVRGITITKQGFLDGEKVADFINNKINNLRLEQMKIPFYVVATELKTGRKTIFNYGNTGQAVQASTAIPSMFVPVKIAGLEYVDGGLVSPVPVDVARQLGADIVIAVDILQQPQYTETTNMWGLFNQNINIMQQRLSQIEMKNADIVIQPDIREKAHIFNIKERYKTILAGAFATQAKVNDIKQIIDQKSEKFTYLQNTIQKTQMVQ